MCVFGAVGAWCRLIASSRGACVRSWELMWHQGLAARLQAHLSLGAALGSWYSSVEDGQETAP